MRIWARLMKENHMIDNYEVELPGPDTRTTKVFKALTEICLHFDLAEPVWLDRNIKEFKRTAKTRFRADNFIENIPFDFMEFQVTEEDLPF